MTNLCRRGRVSLTAFDLSLSLHLSSPLWPLAWSGTIRGKQPWTCSELRIQVWGATGLSSSTARGRWKKPCCGWQGIFFSHSSSTKVQEIPLRKLIHVTDVFCICLSLYVILVILSVEKWVTIFRATLCDLGLNGKLRVSLQLFSIASRQEVEICICKASSLSRLLFYCLNRLLFLSFKYVHILSGFVLLWIFIKWWLWSESLENLEKNPYLHHIYACK